jgi:hypothetical protein
VFFRLTSLELAVLLLGGILGATVLGIAVGRRMRHRSRHLTEPLAVLQAALLGMVGLLLAFGLSMAVGRYDSRRAAVVADANAIGTAYLRAQTLSEPQRTQSLVRLRRYADTSARLSDAVPGSAGSRRAVADGDVLQRELWALASASMHRAPDASAPRLYTEALNAMIDQQTVRDSALLNRVPSAVLWLEILSAAIALGLLAAYLAILGRAFAPVLAAALVVGALLLVTFDLDRPNRGFIEVPDKPVTSLQAAMALPPAAPAQP